MLLLPLLLFLLPFSCLGENAVVVSHPPERRDTLDALLSFLKVSGSPVTGVMELRSLLMAQKEEKILLASLVDQMRVDLQGIRYQMTLQSKEIQFHAAEMTKLRNELDIETRTREELEEFVRGLRVKFFGKNESFNKVIYNPSKAGTDQMERDVHEMLGDHKNVLEGFAYLNEQLHHIQGQLAKRNHYSKTEEEQEIQNPRSYVSRINDLTSKIDGCCANRGEPLDHELNVLRARQAEFSAEIPLLHNLRDGLDYLNERQKELFEKLHTARTEGGEEEGKHMAALEQRLAKKDKNVTDNQVVIPFILRSLKSLSRELKTLEAAARAGKGSSSMPLGSEKVATRYDAATQDDLKFIRASMEAVERKVETIRHSLNKVGSLQGLEEAVRRVKEDVYVLQHSLGESAKELDSRLSRVESQIRGGDGYEGNSMSERVQQQRENHNNVEQTRPGNLADEVKVLRAELRNISSLPGQLLSAMTRSNASSPDYITSLATVLAGLSSEVKRVENDHRQMEAKMRRLEGGAKYENGSWEMPERVLDQNAERFSFRFKDILSQLGGFQKWNDTFFRQLDSLSRKYERQDKDLAQIVAAVKAAQQANLERGQENTEVESLHEHVRSLYQAIEEIGRDHASLKKKVIDSQINRDHLKGMQQALSQINRIMQELKMDTIQVVEYNKHHPLNSAVDELLKMVEGISGDLSDLQRKSAALDETDSHRDRAMEGIAHKLHSLTSGQAEMKGSLGKALEKFDGDMQKIVQQVFQFRDNLESVKSVAYNAPLKADLEKLIEKMREVEREHNSLKGYSRRVGGIDQSLGSIKNVVGQVSYVVQSLKADTEEIVVLNRNRPIAKTLGELIGAVNQMSSSIEAMRNARPKIDSHDKEIEQLRGKVESVDHNLKTAVNNFEAMKRAGEAKQASDDAYLLDMRERRKGQLDMMHRHIQELMAVVQGLSKEHGSLQEQYKGLVVQTKLYESIKTSLGDLSSTVQRLQNDTASLRDREKTKHLSAALDNLTVIVSQLDQNLERVERDLPQSRGAFADLRREVKELAGKVLRMQEKDRAERENNGGNREKEYAEIADGVRAVRDRLSSLGSQFANYQQQDHSNFNSWVKDISNITGSMREEIHRLKQHIFIRDSQAQREAEFERRSTLDEMKGLREGLSSLSSVVKALDARLKQKKETKATLTDGLARKLGERLDVIQRQINDGKASMQRSKSETSSYLTNLSNRLADLQAALKALTVGRFGYFEDELGRVQNIFAETQNRQVYDEKALSSLSNDVRGLEGRLREMSPQFNKTNAYFDSKFQALSGMTEALAKRVETQEAIRQRENEFKQGLAKLGQALQALNRDVASASSKTSERLKEMNQQLAEGVNAAIHSKTHETEGLLQAVHSIKAELDTLRNSKTEARMNAIDRAMQELSNSMAKARDNVSKHLPQWRQNLEGQLADTIAQLKQLQAQQRSTNDFLAKKQDEVDHEIKALAQRGPEYQQDVSAELQSVRQQLQSLEPLRGSLVEMQRLSSELKATIDEGKRIIATSGTKNDEKIRKVQTSLERLDREVKESLGVNASSRIGDLERRVALMSRDLMARGAASNGNNSPRSKASNAEPISPEIAPRPKTITTAAHKIEGPQPYYDRVASLLDAHSRDLESLMHAVANLQEKLNALASKSDNMPHLAWLDEQVKNLAKETEEARQKLSRIPVQHADLIKSAKNLGQTVDSLSKRLDQHRVIIGGKGEPHPSSNGNINLQEWQQLVKYSGDLKTDLEKTLQEAERKTYELSTLAEKNPKQTGQPHSNLKETDSLKNLTAMYRTLRSDLDALSRKRCSPGHESRDNDGDQQMRSQMENTQRTQAQMTETLDAVGKEVARIGDYLSKTVLRSPPSYSPPVYNDETTIQDLRERARRNADSIDRINSTLTQAERKCDVKIGAVERELKIELSKLQSQGYQMPTPEALKHKGHGIVSEDRPGGYGMLQTPQQSILAADCSGLPDGLQSIQPNKTGKPFQVLCAEGRTVIQKRVDWQQDFDKNWEHYKTGFGSLEGSHWLGFDKILQILRCPSGPKYHLVIKVLVGDKALRGSYTSVGLSDERNNYQLSIDGFESTELSDSMSILNGAQFRTSDHGQKCEKGGWWYPPHPQCESPSNLNAPSPTWPLREGGQITHPTKTEMSLEREAAVTFPFLPADLDLRGILSRGGGERTDNAYGYDVTRKQVLFPGVGISLPTIQLNNINVFPKTNNGEGSNSHQFVAFEGERPRRGKDNAAALSYEAPTTKKGK